MQIQQSQVSRRQRQALYSPYEQQGRQSIINNIKMTDIVERSRQSAARILIPMLQQLGYQEGDITIAFRGDMNLNTLINTSIEQP